MLRMQLWGLVVAQSPPGLFECAPSRCHTLKLTLSACCNAHSTSEMGHGQKCSS